MRSPRVAATFFSIILLLCAGFVTPARAADTTKPVTTISLTPAAANGLLGWYVSQPSANVTATDASGIAEIRCVLLPAGTTAPAGFNAIPTGCAYNPGNVPEGRWVLYAASRDAAVPGNVSNVVTKAINVDTTGPAITGYTFSSTPPSGWYTTAVTITFVTSDALSGTVACKGTYSGPDTATATLTVTCKDKAGNATAATSPTFAYDASPPVNVSVAITGGQAGLDGWYSTDVTVTASGQDNVSGIATCTSIVRTAETNINGVSIGGSCTNGAGKTASAAPIVVKLDKTPPSVNVDATPGAIWPPNHQMVDVNAIVNVSDARSGANGFTLLSVISSQPDTGGDIQEFEQGQADTEGSVRAERTPGTSGRVYTLTYTGRDRAGNSATASADVTVGHDARGGPRRAALDAGAGRLLEVQRTDAGWEGTWHWDVDGTKLTTATNMTGVTALGLLEAYADTHEPAYLDAVKAAAGFAMTHLGGYPTGTRIAPRMTALDIVMLHRLTEVTGDISYADRATAEWAHIKTYGDRSTAAALDATFRTIKRRLGAWDLAFYMEAAKLSGDIVYADDAAVILANVEDNFYYGTDNPWYPMTTSGALLCLVEMGYADAFPDAIGTLVNRTIDMLSIDNVDGSIQATAYAGMALRAVGGPLRVIANGVAQWLASAQTAAGGWLEPDGFEYSENNGEALRAVAETIGRNVTVAGFASRAPAAKGWSAVGERGPAIPIP